MLKKCTWILIILAVSLTTVVTQADLIYDNGDFEDDAALVPDAGKWTAGIPTGWQYDDWAGNGDKLQLMNVSTIGDGSEGTVGVRFPNQYQQGARRSAITRFDQPVQPGQYAYTVTLTGTGMGKAEEQNLGGNWLYGKVYWISDPNDPWG